VLSSATRPPLAFSDVDAALFDATLAEVGPAAAI
jgi:hypothetical protein